MRLSGILLVSLFFITTAFANERKVNSKITDVTVFITGAQVTRSASVQLNAGKTHLVFTGLTALLKKESLEITGKGNFKILSINHQIEYDYSEASTEKVESLKQQIEEIKREVEDFNSKLYVIQKEIQIIESIEKHSSQLDTLDISLILKAQEVYHQQLNQLKMEQLQYQRNIKDLNVKQTQLSAQLNGLKIKKSNPRSEIHVMVSSKKSQNAKFNLSYYVINARWYPEYNIRVKDVNSPFSLDYKAKINQQTGEDWNNVNLTLSTNEPNKTSQKPKLNKWELRLNTRTQTTAYNTNRNNYNRFTGAEFGAVKGKVIDEYGDPIPFANVIVSNSTIGTTTDFDGNFSLTLPQGATVLQVSYIGYKKVTQPINAEFLQIVMEENAAQLNEVVVVSNVRGARSNANYIYQDGVQKIASREIKNRKKKFQATRNNYTVARQSVNVVDVAFEIEENHTILSSVENHTIQINTLNVPAAYQYYCAPKMDKDVFLTALVEDWEQYNLLEGKTTIFYEGTYIGTSLMNVRYVSDTLDISLGRDRNIQVNRQKTKDYKRKELLGSDFIEDRKWNIAIKNNKPYDINIIVEDQVPVTKDKRIQIKYESSDNAKLNKDEGILTWDLKLKPEKLKDVQFKYAVTYPKGNQVYLE